MIMLNFPIVLESLINKHKYLQSAWWITSRAIIILLILCLLVWNTYLFVIMVNVNMNDFGKFYYSAVGYLQGRNIYDINPAIVTPISILEYEILLNLNPPHFILLILPLAFFSPNIALFFWFLLNIICLLFSLFIIFNTVEVKFNAWRIMLLVISLLAFAGTGGVLITGQLSFILMLLITLFWFESRNGRWGRAGFYLGLSLSIKLFFLIFVPYLLMRKKCRTMILACGVNLFCYGLGIMIFGWETYSLWLRNLGLADWGWLPMNVSFQGFFTRLLTSNPQFQPFFCEPALVKPLWMLAGGLVGILTLSLTVRDTSRTELDRSYALLLVAAQLISPLGWIYYAFLVFGPLIALMISWHRIRDEEKGVTKAMIRTKYLLLFIALLGFLIPVPFILSFQPSALVTLVWGSAYFWATLALWIVLFFDGLLTQRVSEQKV